MNSFETEFGKLDLDSNIDADFILAIQLQMQQDDEAENEVVFKGPIKSALTVQKPLTDPEWDLIDPCPDIRSMFIEFDRLYFWSRLGSCRLEWSKRMTQCAGIFYLREGGVIRLSEPLLKFRPRKDLVETLLHEMIHAYLYLTRNFKDRGDHGDEFKSHMNRINRLANTSITIYHSFHDEVNYAKRHVWRCNGICRTFPPFYGYVRRAMNRAPSKNDFWWSQHQATCNGTFEKISEPDPLKPKSSQKEASQAQSKKLDEFFSSTKTSASSSSSTWLSSSKATTSSNRPIVKKENNNFQRIDSYLATTTKRKSDETNSDIICLDDDIKSSKVAKKEIDDDVFVIAAKSSSISINKRSQTECPICFQKFSQELISYHVNSHF